MATKSTEKKTSLEPSEIFCAIGLLIETKKMRDLVKDKTGTELLNGFQLGDEEAKKVLTF